MLNFQGNKIILSFDEYVQVENPFERVIVSPTPKRMPDIENKLKVVTVRLRDTLEANTTYVIDFGGSIMDINENNKLKDYRYIFSTGSQIDEGTLSGQVWIAETGKVDSTFIVMLHRNLDDSAVAKETPRYYTRVNAKGKFTFRNLAPGTYHVFALKDADGMKRFDQPYEEFAFLDQPVIISEKEDSVTLYAFAPQEEKVKKTPPATEKKDTDKRLRYTVSSSGGRQDLLTPLTVSFENPVKTMDSTLISFTDTLYKPLPFRWMFDSTRKVLTVEHTFRENTGYRLLLGKGLATDSLGKTLTRTDTIRFTTAKESEYGSVKIRFNNYNPDVSRVLQLIQGDKIYKSIRITGPQYFERLFQPGEYEIRFLEDRNGNGVWDRGDYWNKLQPERVRAETKKMSIRANWDNEFIFGL
jgi:hypothetical protein